MNRCGTSGAKITGLRNGAALIAVRSLAFGLALILGCSRVEKAETKPAPPESKAAVAPEGITHQRVLPSGNLCRVELRGPISPKGIASTLQGLKISITNREVHVPTEAFADLTNVQTRQGVEFAEFAGDTFLLVGGGENGMDWQAKFVVRDFHLTERELKRTGQTSLLVRYAPPFQVRYFPLPAEEVDRVRRQENHRPNERSSRSP